MNEAVCLNASAVSQVLFSFEHIISGQWLIFDIHIIVTHIYVKIATYLYSRFKVYTKFKLAIKNQMCFVRKKKV